ncbi:hypothetical protein QTP88_020443 [Uroleucon formosanum]
MFNRFVEMETSIRGTLGLLDNAPDTLRPEDWTILQDLIKILKPFEEATKAISGQKYMTASLVIVIVQGLYKVCNNLLKINLSPRALLVAKKLISNMDAREGFKNCEKSMTLSKCTFLDPRFKHLPFMNINQIKNEVIENIAQIIRDKEQPCQSDVIMQPTPIPESGELSIWSEIDLNVARFTPLGTAKSRAIVEVQRYLDDAVIARNQDPLKWWKGQSYNYPNLSILAKNYLCHLSTSVPCERIFSSAGLVLNDRRCRLKNEKENKKIRVECSQKLLNRYHQGEQFLLKIVTSDETGVHHYDPEEKRQSMEYRNFTSPQPKKFKDQPSAGKIMLTVFWDGNQVYLTDYFEKGTSVNSAQYIESLKKLRRPVCRIRGSTDTILLHHDNARPHTLNATSTALKQWKFEVLQHPPYSPDLAPCDFHFFPDLKRDLKGTHFTSDEEVKEAVKSWIKERPATYFSDGMKKLVTRWEKCISVNGDYIEK